MKESTEPSPVMVVAVHSDSTGGKGSIVSSEMTFAPLPAEGPVTITLFCEDESRFYTEQITLPDLVNVSDDTQIPLSAYLQQDEDMSYYYGDMVYPPPGWAGTNYDFWMALHHITRGEMAFELRSVGAEDVRAGSGTVAGTLTLESPFPEDGKDHSLRCAKGIEEPVSHCKITYHNKEGRRGYTIGWQAWLALSGASDVDASLKYFKFQGRWYEITRANEQTLFNEGSVLLSSIYTKDDLKVRLTDSPERLLIDGGAFPARSMRVRMALAENGWSTVSFWSMSLRVRERQDYCEAFIAVCDDYSVYERAHEAQIVSVELLRLPKEFLLLRDKLSSAVVSYAIQTPSRVAAALPEYGFEQDVAKATPGAEATPGAKDDVKIPDSSEIQKQQFSMFAQAYVDRKLQFLFTLFAGDEIFFGHPRINIPIVYCPKKPGSDVGLPISLLMSGRIDGSDVEILNLRKAERVFDHSVWKDLCIILNACKKEGIKVKRTA